MKKALSVMLAALLATVLPMAAQERLQDSLEQISEEFGIEYVYDAGLRLDVPSGGVPAAGMSLRKSLNVVLKGTGITWTRKKRVVILKRSPSHAALPQSVQERWIKASRIQSVRDVGIYAVRPGTMHLPEDKIKQFPALFGEADVMKTLQALPGVSSGMEGFSGIHVRGGSSDENLILIDGVPMYATDHFSGLFSAIPADDIRSVSFYKGSFPARFGGGASSILDIRAKDGDYNEHHRNFGIGLISDRFHFDGPIVSGSTSYSFTGRLMHTFFISPLVFAIGGGDSPLYYYDVNAKVSHIISGTDKLIAGFYYGMDRLLKGGHQYGFSDDVMTETVNKTNSGRGGMLGSIRWEHVFGKNLNSTVALSVSRGSSRYKASETVKTGDAGASNLIEHYSGLTDYRLTSDFEYKPVQSHDMVFGVALVLHSFTPKADRIVSNDRDFSYPINGRTYIPEYSVYADDSFNLGRRIGADAGARLVVYQASGKNYVCIEPRVALKMNISRAVAVKAAYSRITQGTHIIKGTEMVFPNVTWVPVSADLSPLKSDICSLAGVVTPAKGWEFSLEGFWKYQQNVPEYINSILEMYEFENWEYLIASGIGKAYGAELYLARTEGRITGWSSYSLSKSMRIFPDGSINRGEWFPASHDHTHKIDINVNYRLTENIGINAFWTYSSGGWVTIPDRQGRIGETGRVMYAPSKNNYRLPSSHRLDVSANINIPKRTGESIWSFGVYNIYAHKNPVFVGYETGDDGKTSVKTEAPLILIPSICYTRKF